MKFVPILLFLKSAKEKSNAAEAVLLKHRAQQRLQQFVLKTKQAPGFRLFYSSLYSLATKLFVGFTLQAQRETGLRVVEAIYLRRGGGRGELVFGASDLDFFIVLNTVSAQQEMLFLKRFWRKYSFYRNLLPFLGETLMGDRNELEDWLQTGCVRAFETGHSWKLLHGPNVLKSLPPPAALDQRDVFSEALKCYWALVQPVLKVQDEQLASRILPNSRSATLLRHGVKAALDLFRLHLISGKSGEEALAALEARVVSPGERITCPGYMDLGESRFHCWSRYGHGGGDLRAGLKHSCDVYFYEVARRTGIDKIAGKQANLYRGLVEGAVGEFDHAILLRQYVGELQGTDAAEHWRGGWFRLYEHKKTQRPLLSYISEWDTPAAARRYFELYQRVLKGKWKRMEVASSNEDEVTGIGDSGRFTLRIAGTSVQCYEGLAP